jgi:hypothetical protein
MMMSTGKTSFNIRVRGIGSGGEMNEVKRRRRTPLQAGGACEAPPHEVDTKSI